MPVRINCRWLTYYWLIMENYLTVELIYTSLVYQGSFFLDVIVECLIG